MISQESGEKVNEIFKARLVVGGHIYSEREQSSDLKSAKVFQELPYY